MYLVIFEDGEIKKMGKITDDEINASNSGYLTLIDIGDCKPKVHIEKKWNDVDYVE